MALNGSVQKRQLGHALAAIQILRASSPFGSRPDDRAGLDLIALATFLAPQGRTIREKEPLLLDVPIQATRYADSSTVAEFLTQDL